MKVNKKLLPIKAHYFFKNAAAALLMPFVPVIAKDSGFSGSAIGLVLTTVPLLSLVTKPLACAAADRFRAHKIFYLFFLVVNAGFLLLIRALPPLPTDNGVTIKCGDGADVVVTTARSDDECFMGQLRMLMDNVPLPCQMSCNDTQDLVNSLDSHTRYWDVDKSNGELSVGISFPLVKENHQIYMKVDYINTSSQSWLEPSCSSPGEWRCWLSCNNSVIHDIVTKPTVRGTSLFSYSQFWMFVVIVFVAKCSARNLATMGDTICFKLLGGDKQNDVGLQMLWGSASWGLLSVATGFAVDSLSEGKPVRDFTYVYYVTAVLFVLNAAAGLCFDLKEDKTALRSSGIVRDVRQQVFTNPKFLIFLACVVACGASSALIWNYLLWFIVEVAREEGCSDTIWVRTLNGLAICVQCYFGEIPFYILSGRMISKLGHSNCMSLVLLGFGLRFTAYYFLKNPWWILPLEILNGLTFATLNSAMVTYANALAPAGTEATVQGIVSAAFEGIGVSLGAFMGSQVIRSWGVRSLFLAAGLASTTLAVLHTAVQFLWDKREHDTPHLMTYNDRKLPPEQFQIDQGDPTG
uniref:Major facilitator superfamily domain-containing protein 6 n=1 Tax=Lygus hesperus TaxID=30085 RepID=A0A146KKX9_LYGHE